MTAIHKPVIHIEELGELGRLPDGGIINAGGTSGPHFTIDGKAVILADGTASDGSGQVISVSVGAQVQGFEFIQAVPSVLWVIPHNKNTKRIQISIWDAVDELLFSDSVQITDPDTVSVHFNTAVSGRAILMLF